MYRVKIPTESRPDRVEPIMSQAESADGVVDQDQVDSLLSIQAKDTLLEGLRWTLFTTSFCSCDADIGIGIGSNQLAFTPREIDTIRRDRQ